MPGWNSLYTCYPAANREIQEERLAMSTDLRAEVYPILDMGIALWESRSRGDRLERDSEQAALKGELNKKSLRDLDESLGALTDREIKEIRQARGSITDFADKRFLGLRYVLAVWLDEIMIGGGSDEAEPDSWSRGWNESKLERDLFSSTDRGFAFPMQAAWLLQQRDFDEVLEIYYLCVMLGFGGKWDPSLSDQIRVLDKASWVKEAREHITRNLDARKMNVQELELPAAATPPLVWHGRLEKMGLVAAIVSLVLLLVVVVCVFSMNME